MNVPEMTLALYQILKAGGFTTGGMAFDDNIRRQSLDPEDLLYAHVGSMDAIGRGLLNAAVAALVGDGSLKSHIFERYSGWNGDLGRSILAGERVSRNSPPMFTNETWSPSRAPAGRNIWKA